MSDQTIAASSTFADQSGDKNQCECSSWAATVVAEPAEVLSNEKVNTEYRHIVVGCGSISATAAPGQFFQLLCPHAEGDQPFLRRPMSLYDVDPLLNRAEFLYKVAGAGTRGLATLQVKLDIMGPLGVGFTLDLGLRHIVVVGRGAGLATLAPLAKAAKANSTSVTAILSARRPELLVSVDIFESHGADVIVVTDSESTSGPANVERILRELIADGRCDSLYTCGSSRLLRVQQRLSREFNIPGQVAMEQQMACGLGLCFCCVRDFNVGDGPVFDMMEALPW